jgi:hypothetical protein
VPSRFVPSTHVARLRPLRGSHQSTVSRAAIAPPHVVVREHVAGFRPNRMHKQSVLGSPSILRRGALNRG